MSVLENNSPIIDFGAHFNPDKTFPEEEEGRKQVEMIGPILRDTDTLREFYETSFADGAVLSQPVFMGHHDLERTREANDVLKEVVDSLPGFYSLAAIPINAGAEEAAEEFERCLENGMNGGGIETKTDGVEIDDPMVRPTLEVANRTGAPIMVHPKIRDSLAPGVLDDDYMLNAIFGREAGLCESICKVVHQNFYDEFPNLKLVFHHSGGNIASMLGRASTYLDRSRWADWGGTKAMDYPEFKEHLDNIYIDTSGYGEFAGPLRNALENLPNSHILFGTDYPYEIRTSEDMDRRVEKVDEVASEEQARQVLSENILNVLHNVDT